MVSVILFKFLNEICKIPKGLKEGLRFILRDEVFINSIREL